MERHDNKTRHGRTYQINRFNSKPVDVTEENSHLKSDSNAEKPTDDAMRVVFVFLGVFGGVLILFSICIVSYCIHRRRNVNKHMNNGTYITNIL